MIRSFMDALTEDIFKGLNTKTARQIPQTLWRTVRRKLAVLDGATSLADIQVTPGYRLHPLKGDQAGRHAIWINDQYRISFRFDNGDAHEVRCEDYH